jgi:hypothetical protein
MKNNNTWLLIFLLLIGLCTGLQAQHTVTGCEEVTGLQTFLASEVEVSASGHFINRGTVEYIRVTNLINYGGFSDQSNGASCSASYYDPCVSAPAKPSAKGSAAVAGLNIFDNTVPTTQISGSQAIRMRDVTLERKIQLDNEWQISGAFTWQGGLITTDRSDLSNFLHFLQGSSLTGESQANHVNGYVGWSGQGDFLLPTGDSLKMGQVGLAGTCGTLYKAAYFSTDPSAATLPAGAPFNRALASSSLYVISNLEYWDVDGADSTRITLYFDAASGLDTMARIEDLVVVGWDGSEWVSLGQTAVSGPLSGSGSVTSETLIPNDYAAYTFGFFCPPPTAICRDVTVYLDAGGNGSLLAAAVDSNSLANCGLDTMFLSLNSFGCSDIGGGLAQSSGLSTILTVVNEAGLSDSCTAHVTVLDTVPPAALCKNPTAALNAAGNLTLSVTAVDDSSFDACGIASSLLSQTSFNCTHLGANSVTLTITDTHGNSSSCTATVTIVDNTPPVAQCKPASVILDSSGNGSLSVAALNNGSTDACGLGNLSLSQSSFHCSEVGNNTVTLTVSDGSGNTATCSATVTVLDNTAPTAQCQPATVQLNAAGTALLQAAAVNNNSTDACGIGSLSLSQMSFNCSHLGANAVTLTVTDNNGNSSSCTATVTVVDGVQPSALCKNPTVYLDGAGQLTLTAAQVNNGSSDACGIVSMSVSPASFNCSHIGANAVTLTVQDASGNMKTCSALVTVADNTPPVLVCQNITLPVKGLTTLNPAQVFNAAASYDNCSVLTPLSVFPSQFNCINDGNNIVVLTVSDGHGNTATCQSTVQVEGPTLTITTTPADCGEFNGSIAMTVTEGDGQPGYSIDGGDNYILINEYTGLTAGLYTAVVTFFGGSGCTLPPVPVVLTTGNEVTVTWTGGGDGIQWSDQKNWDTGFVPYPCNDVVIPAGHHVLVSNGVIAAGRTLFVDTASVLTMEPEAFMNIIPY